MFINLCFTGVRSYLISTGADLLICIATPLVVVYNCSVSDSKVRQILRDFRNFIQNR